MEDVLVQEFDEIIHYWARFFRKRFKYHILSVEDLVASGYIGLMLAKKKFDNTKNIKFKTYAEFRIRGEMLDELRRHDYVKRTERRRLKNSKTQLDLVHTSFTDEDIAIESEEKNYEHLESRMVIESVPSQEQNILYLHYYKDKTFLDIAKTYHMSEGRIWQIHESAIKDLKKKLSKDIAA